MDAGTEEMWVIIANCHYQLAISRSRLRLMEAEFSDEGSVHHIVLGTHTGRTWMLASLCGIEVVIHAAGGCYLSVVTCLARLD